MSAAYATGAGSAVTIPSAAVSPRRAGQGGGPRAAEAPTPQAAGASAVAAPERRAVPANPPRNHAIADAILRAAGAVTVGEADV